nr:hypothetical protein [Actinomycetota bacterium]
GRVQPRRAGRRDLAGRLAADGPDGTGAGACTVRGPASAVYLFLWNRSGLAPADVTISGDQGLLTSWRSSVRVRWS